MRWPWIVSAMLVLAGCAGTPGPAQEDEPASGLAVSASRVDSDGDGFTDTLELQLHGSAEPIAREELGVQLDASPVEVSGFGNATTWEPGTTLEVPCPAGTNEYRLTVRGELVRLLVLECGTPPATPPLFFQADLIDGDGDGDEATVELTLVTGGPAPANALSARFGDTPVRLFEDAFKTHLADGSLENGTRVYTACDPEADELVVLWGERELPPLTVRGCQAHEPGLDAPLEVGPVDADGDGEIDGLNLTLGASSQAPFHIEDVNATWSNGTARLNATAGLEPPPPSWGSNTSLVAICPSAGEQRFELAIEGTLVLRRFVVCQAPPGDPLVELDLTPVGDGLEAELVLSRVGALALENVTDRSGASLGEGVWEVDRTVSLPCPDGQLVLRYDQRLAYRGPAPC